MDVKGKKVIVIGLGRSGVSAARLLIARDAKVDISDSQDSPLIRKNSELLGNVGAGVEVGGHTENFIQGHEIAVISPGVRQGATVISWLKATGTQIISEIELASCLFKGQIIAITGTNGKTTVTGLIAKILKDAGRKVVVCGNIGNPFSNEVTFKTADLIAVVEVSSFQLEWIKSFRPHISLLLNISDDHLDRYQDFNHYLETKFRISINQEESDYCLLNSNDPHLEKVAARTRARVLYFAKQKKNFDLNQQAAMLVGSLYGLTQAKMIKSLKAFRYFEHRMEYVDTVNGIKFINDSKATNVGAVKWALERISEPVILIAGGRDKKNDFKKLRRCVRDRVKKAVLVGETKLKLKRALAGLIPLKEASTFTEAFNLAYNIAQPGEVVLLSPACASFDMFSNFEERGKTFKDLVKRCKEQS